ncbi:hypothetical protein HanIR_Chr09g0416361 [Helianthus annuus]|nr:hypothetical protein HanIR_Chr09g0416361 [Helianthus annuus]
MWLESSPTFFFCAGYVCVFVLFCFEYKKICLLFMFLCEVARKDMLNVLMTQYGTTLDFKTFPSRVTCFTNPVLHFVERCIVNIIVE